MATSSIFTSIELNEDKAEDFLRAISKSKIKQIKKYKCKKEICDYCNKEIRQGKQYICKINEELYSGHKHCMMKLIHEEDKIMNLGQLTSLTNCKYCGLPIEIYPDQKDVVCKHCGKRNDLEFEFSVVEGQKINKDYQRNLLFNPERYKDMWIDKDNINNQIDYDRLLNKWFDKVMKEVDRYEVFKERIYEENGCDFKYGKFVGYINGLIMATSILSRLENKEKRKLKKLKSGF